MATIHIPDELAERCELAAKLMGTTLDLWLINILAGAAESDIEDEASHGSLAPDDEE